MRKSFEYRIYPNKEQVRQLNETLELCRQLYNASLEQRIKGYRQGYMVNYYSQNNELPLLKKDTLYSNVDSHVLKEVLRNVDKAYQNFFSRIKKGKNKLGFPRFKSVGRFNSFLYDRVGKRIFKDSRFYLPKIGYVKIEYHREYQGILKTLCVKRVNNKWFIILCCDNAPIKDKITNIVNKVGIDLGLTSFITTSDNHKVENPKYLKQSEGKIKELQRQLATKKKGSNNRHKIKSKLSKTFEKVTNQRKDFLDKISRWLVNNYDLIAYEDLKIQKMKENTKLKGRQKRNINRGISDVSWGKFINMVTYKAEEAGKISVAVNPRNTSKTCSLCGYINEDLKLSDKIYKCPQCGITLDRDYNASCNILRLGTSQYVENPLHEATIS